MHGSEAGAPLIRQTNDGPSRWVPVVVKPAPCSAPSPLLGSPAAQPTWIPPSGPKSTTTVTPVVPEHAAAPAAGAGPASTSAAAPIRTAPAPARAARVCARVRARVRQV